MSRIYSIITGTGSYIPENIVKNSDFINHIFHNEDGSIIDSPTETIIEKFTQITDIKERRHLEDDLSTSDSAHLASKKAIEGAGIDPETLDYIIVAHNFGDIAAGSVQSQMLPSIASRVKHKLGIKNPKTVAYDMVFGCPGWIQALIQADFIIRSGDAKRVLVIGAETLSRISDPHDRDSMIYADGAGATILEAKESDEPIGIITHATRTDTTDEAYYLYNGKSFNKDADNDDLYIKMYGRKIYNYALSNVPSLVKESIEKAGVELKDISKILIHQANAKMDEAILIRLFKLYGVKEIPEGIMPMTINKLGNSSVATVPTLLDLILSGQMENQKLSKDDMAVFASVGAGMNINSLVYKFHK